ncbi:hypothetical protein D3C71_1186480 [compost metagenome]
MLLYAKCTVATPTPAAIPVRIPSQSVRSTHIILVGPNGIAIESPAPAPAIRHAIPLMVSPNLARWSKPELAGLYSHRSEIFLRLASKPLSIEFGEGCQFTGIEI